MSHSNKLIELRRGLLESLNYSQLFKNKVILVNPATCTCDSLSKVVGAVL